ncbi:hypothetical protein BH10PSE1_BH10PSE1_05880 [soil metagenome]
MQTRHWIIAATILWVVVIVIECLSLWGVRPFGGTTALYVWGALLLVWALALIKVSPPPRWRWAWRILPPFSLLLPAALFMAIR